MENIKFENLLKEKFNGLSTGQKKVAEYLIQQLEEAAFSTAVQISRKAEVSETTVIRLSYALGFSGFSEMQEKIIKQILKHNNSPLMVTGSDSHTNIDDELNPFAKIIENDIRNLNQSLHQLNVEDMWKVVDALIHADRILIVGFRMTYAAAYWFSLMLSTLRENVDLCPLTGDVYEKLCNLTEKSVVFVLSFPRYAKEPIHIAECAKKQGLTVLSVTDRTLSPVGRISDIALTTEESVDSEPNSMSLVISLLGLIISGMNMKDKARIQARQQKLEQLYSNYDVFIE